MKLILICILCATQLELFTGNPHGQLYKLLARNYKKNITFDNRYQPSTQKTFQLQKVTDFNQEAQVPP